MPNRASSHVFAAILVLAIIPFCRLAKAQTGGTDFAVDTVTQLDHQTGAESESQTLQSNASNRDSTSDETSGSGKKAKKWKLKPPKVNGYIQVFYRYAIGTGTDGIVDNDNFRVQRVRIEFSGKVLPWVSYDVEFDPRAPDITGILRDAFIGLDFIPHQEIRIGQQKMPFGYENQASSTELFAVNRAEVSDNLSRGVNLRDIGIGLVGKVPLGKCWRIEDAIAVSNGAGLNVQNDNTPRKNVFGRAGLRYKKGDFWTGLGVSGAEGDFMDSLDLIDFRRYGADLEIEHQWFFIASEFVFGQDKTNGALDEIPGFYINLVGKTPWPAGPIIRFDLLGDSFERWTFGAYYGRASDAFRMLFNYELRSLFEDATGHIGRGDDKVYVWAQVKF